MAHPAQPQIANAEQVPIENLKPHPSNPRRGDIKLLATSLATHGQYRPIVAQRSTSHILAGNHTWEAARRLKWPTIAVTWVDVDDRAAAQIMLADNRTSDLASYDHDALCNLLQLVPSLEGTGFDLHEVQDLLKEPESDLNLTATPSNPDLKPDIEIGPHQIWVEPLDATLWRAFHEQDTPKQTVTHIRTLLKMTEPRKPKSLPATVPHIHEHAVQLDQLIPHPLNARQGDIGAISESLRTLGQYRPIVVNLQTMHILVGNHTWQAAKALKWTHIRVNWLDIPPEKELAILLIDNRSADRATYDDQLLLEALKQTPLAGTGFTNDDLDDLINDINNNRPYRRSARTSDIRCRVFEWKWKVDRTQWEAWDTHTDPHHHVAQQLNLPVNSWTKEKPT